MTGFVETTHEIPQLLAEYERTAVEWDAAANDAGTANRLFELNYRLFTRLRQTVEGRDGIADLMHHPLAGVRVLAATHSLAWREADAVSVLEALAREAGVPSVTARNLLRSHRAGKLTGDW